MIWNLCNPWVLAVLLAAIVGGATGRLLLELWWFCADRWKR